MILLMDPALLLEKNLRELGRTDSLLYPCLTFLKN